MKHIGLSLLFLSSSLLAASSEEIKWAPTELKPLFLDNTITERFCGYEAIRFKGCVAAVEMFARFKDPKREIALSNGNFNFETTNQASLKESNFREYQRTQRLKLNKIEKEFSPIAVSSLVKLYAELRAENPNPKPHESALPLNESLAVTYDPHKQWIPLFNYNGLNRVRLNPIIGVELEQKNGQVIVAATVVNGSAEKAGLKSDDIILEINGKPAINDPFIYKDKQIVSLKVKRENRTFNTSVQFSWKHPGKVIDREINFKGTKYSYLHLSEVPENLDPASTCRLFAKFLSEFNKKHEGMVLDLRNNIGGPGDTAACISGLFLGPKKHIYTESDFSDQYVEPVFSDFPQAFTKKMVILVNASTASSGEIITSALQFHGRGIVLGDRTFGKAIGQIQEDYSKDRIALLFTSLKAYLPDGTSYHGKGVSPDVYVYQHGMKPSARELETLREEDLALFSLKIEDSKFYEKAQVGVKFPSACVKEENVKKNMSLLADTNWEKDFQLQFGLETLSCLKK